MSFKHIVTIALSTATASTVLLVGVGLALPRSVWDNAVATEPIASTQGGPTDVTSNHDDPSKSPAAGATASPVPTSAGSGNTTASAPPAPGPAPASNPTANPPAPAPNPAPNPAPSPAPAPTPAPPPPPPAPTPAPPACGSAGGTCSTSQVAAHNSSGNCWVIYNGSYYIVTSYVSAHPGGTSVFNSSTCGSDITGYLSGSQSTAGKNHQHGSTAYNVINSYKVGPVQ